LQLLPYRVDVLRGCDPDKRETSQRALPWSDRHGKNQSNAEIKKCARCGNYIKKTNPESA
jgi:hypothetical protein